MYSFLGQPYVPSTPKGGIALPGLVTVRDETKYCWSERLNKQNDKWREGRSHCERPRTYDKFYQKTPGNFQALVSFRYMIRIDPKIIALKINFQK